MSAAPSPDKLCSHRLEFAFCIYVIFQELLLASATTKAFAFGAVGLGAFSSVAWPAMIALQSSRVDPQDQGAVAGALQASHVYGIPYDRGLLGWECLLVFLYGRPWRLSRADGWTVPHGQRQQLASCRRLGCTFGCWPDSANTSVPASLPPRKPVHYSAMHRGAVIGHMYRVVVSAR